jgi:hypothetical protein
MKVVQSLEELKCCLGLKLAHQGVKLVYHESCQPQLTHSFFLHKVYIYSLHRQQNNLQMEKAKLMHQALHPLFSLSFDDRLQIFDSNVSLTCPNLTHNLFCSHPNHKKIWYCLQELNLKWRFGDFQILSYIIEIEIVCQNFISPIFYPISLISELGTFKLEFQTKLIGLRCLSVGTLAAATLLQSYLVHGIFFTHYWAKL